MTLTPIEWLYKKKNIDKNGKKKKKKTRTWAHSVDEQMRREKENQIEGRVDEEKEDCDLRKSVVGLLMRA